MQKVFLGLFGFLVFMSMIAWGLYPRIPYDGRIHISISIDENPSTLEQVERFNEENPDLHLAMNFEQGSENVKTIVQTLAGVGSDLIVSHYAADLDAYVRAGIARDLTDDMAALGVDPEKDLWAANTGSYRHANGRYYGFPHNVAVNCLWYHKELVEKAGIELPIDGMTWEEFIEIGKALTIRDEKGEVIQYGFGIDWLRWRLFVKQWGGQVYSDDGTHCVLDSPEAIEGIQFMYDLMYRYKIAPTPMAEAAMSSQAGMGKDTAIATQFGAKRIATAMGGRWWMIMLRRYEGLNLGVAEGPHAKHRLFFGYGKAVVVNALSPHQEEAMRFIKYLSGETFHEVIHKHADGFGSKRSWAYERETLDDPNYPMESWNEVWRDTMEHSQAERSSPFANSRIVLRMVVEQLDLMKNDLKSPEEAMRTAAKNVNESMAENIEERSDLQRLYFERTGEHWNLDTYHAKFVDK